MLKTFAPFCVSFVLLGTSGYGQKTPIHPSSVTQEAQSSHMTGTVRSFEAGKNIEVDATGEFRKYDLASPGATFNISPEVKVGDRVELTDQTDSSGHQTVTVVRTSSDPNAS